MSVTKIGIFASQNRTVLNQNIYFINRHYYIYIYEILFKNYNCANIITIVITNVIILYYFTDHVSYCEQKKYRLIVYCRSLLIR